MQPCGHHKYDSLCRQNDRRGELPEAPASFDGVDLEIAYTSPSAQAQYATRLSDISAFMRDLAPLAQIKPELLQSIDGRELFDSYAKYRNVSPSVVRSQEDIDAENAAAAEAQQEQMVMQQAPQMAGAVKDIAQAKQADPEVGNLLNI